MEIRTDCYLAVAKKYKENFPDAHFEYVMRARFNSILAPTVSLLIKAGIYKTANGTKNEKMSWKQYKKEFIREIIHNKDAIKRIKELIEIAKEKTIFLICMEKDPSECHRTILQELMLSLG